MAYLVSTTYSSTVALGARHFRLQPHCGCCLTTRLNYIHYKVSPWRWEESGQKILLMQGDVLPNCKESRVGILKEFSFECARVGDFFSSEIQKSNIVPLPLSGNILGMHRQ